jgi:hypothetical protein
MNLKSFAAVVFGAASVAFAAPAAAGVVVVSETRVMNPPEYNDHVIYNLPDAGLYDVQVTSDEALYVSAFWRWTEVTEVRIDPPHPLAGQLVYQKQDSPRTGGFVAETIKSYAFSFQIPETHGFSSSYCPIVCPSELSDAPSTVTFVTTKPFLEFYNDAVGPLTAPFEYTVTITRRDAAVPEPATWALMIVGFGMAGGAVRSRRGDLSRAA